MASLTKKDVNTLYGRAAQLSQEALDIDGHADQLRQDGMVSRAAAHRTIAQMMREEAVACRQWADGSEAH
jgi:hypothetical protein